MKYSVVTTMVCSCLGLFLQPPANARPHQPADDATVVATLPTRWVPELTALAGLRQQWRRDPANLEYALPLAHAYVQAARRTADPRYYGYAQQVLSLWSSGTSAPAAVRVLSATILQARHRFPEALTLLDTVLLQQPTHAQARLTRATVLQVQGEFVAAQRDCAGLWRTAGDVVTQLCLASVAAVNGQQVSAQQLAARALRNAAVGDQTSRLWAQTLLAEIAMRNGAHAQADSHFRDALAMDADDAYLLAAYGDFLLARGEARRVLALMQSRTRDDNLLLRHALALRSLTAVARSAAQRQEWRDALATSTTALRERHEAALRRGDRTHLREAARMHLELLQQPAAALVLAKENWNTQKEPADAQILLQSGLAAGDAGAPRQIAAWLQSSGLHDVQLQALLRSAPQKAGT